MTLRDLLLAVIALLGGAAVGSACTVVIDRLPRRMEQPNEHGELVDTRPWSEVLSGPSRCSGCGAPIRSIDNVPVVSALMLRGKCRSCGAGFGRWHAMVELAVPLVGLALVLGLGATWFLVPVLVAVPALVCVAWIDARFLIVPTSIVWPAFGAVVVSSVVAAFVESMPEVLVSSALGVAVLAGPLAALWWFMPRGMGFGDVRLAVLLGWMVGLVAGRTATVVLASIGVLVVASLIGVVGTLIRGRLGDPLPFGPPLVAAALLAVAMSPVIDRAVATRLLGN